MTSQPTQAHGGEMDEKLRKDIRGIIASIALVARTGTSIPVNYYADQIYASFIKHDYGQKDEKARLPAIKLGARQHPFYEGYAKAMDDYEREGWHKDKEE